MNKKHPTAFISYSWDTSDHSQWVFDLSNNLRKKGIDSKIDKTLVGQSTVNLPQMMISNIRDNDYTIIVLTENYAKRADELTGGVGFENFLLSNNLLEDKDKYIFIMKHKGDYEKVFPFHFKGFYAIDFSDDSQYDEKFEELLHRIYKIPLYEEAELGEIPELKPKKSIIDNTEDGFSDTDIPTFKNITDLDKVNFLNYSFNKIVQKLERNLHKTKQRNANFDFQFKQIHAQKYIGELFIDGDLKTGFKIWLDKQHGSSLAINLAYGTGFSIDHDSSMNEIITCEIINNDQLELRTMMSNFNRNGKGDIDSVFNSIWESIIQNLT